MITTTRMRQACLALAAGAIAVTGAACTTAGSPVPSAEALSALATPQPAPTAAAPPATSTQDTRGAITLGDLDPRADANSVGAPFDPCGIGWQAFPADVRPPGDKKPALRPPGERDGFAVGCRYDNSDSIRLDSDSNQVGVPQHFIAIVAWGTELSAAPADHPGSTPTAFAGKPGVLIPGKAPNGENRCTALVALNHGVGAVGVTNGRFPIDTCSIATSVATAIASRTP